MSPSNPTGDDVSPLIEERIHPGREGQFSDTRYSPEFTDAPENVEDLGIRYSRGPRPTSNPFDDDQASGNFPYKGYSTEFEIDDRAARRHRASTGSLYSTLSKEQLKRTAPWRHESSKSSLALATGSSTVKTFDNRDQRRRVFISGLIRWLRTVVICGATAGCLGYFSKPDYLSANRKYTFNTVITGLLIAMSLELGSVLKAHARLLRWRFLASQYRTLKDFELIMGCDSLTTTTKLLWKGRTRGKSLPNMTQLVALICILINVAVQVFPAVMGLTFSLDTNDDFLDLLPGSVSVANLSAISTSSIDGTGADELQASLANIYGRSGQFYDVESDIPVKEQFYTRTVYTNANNTKYWHRFWDINPEQTQKPVEGASYRTVSVQSQCQQLKLLDGGYAGFGDANDQNGNIVFIDAQGRKRTEFAGQQSTAAVTWMSNFTGSACGPRCAHTYALLAADNSTVPQPQLWYCNTTVSNMTFPNNSYSNPQDYQMPDLTAFLFAGAIGWSGIDTSVTNANGSGTHINDLQNVLYTLGSTFHDLGVAFNNIQPTDVANLIMMYSAMAISAYDDLGPRKNVTGYFPVTTLHLNVTWKFSAAILIGIPVGMLLVLLAVVTFASKTIIKDETYLSAAKLLKPVVEKLGDRGCLLDGDEIADELGNYKIIYGVRTPGEKPVTKEELEYGNVKRRTYSTITNAVRHLDVIEESEGFGYIHGRMPAGDYDGRGHVGR